MVHLFASRHEGTVFNPQGLTYVKLDFPVSVVSLHWGLWCDWTLWPRLRRASSRTITSLSYWQCDITTWYHTALLSQFHACYRSSFWLHNRHSRLLGGSPVESLQCHCIYTQSHCSSGPPVCFLSWGTQVHSPGVYLCETGILLLAARGPFFPHQNISTGFETKISRGVVAIVLFALVNVSCSTLIMSLYLYWPYGLPAVPCWWEVFHSRILVFTS